MARKAPLVASDSSSSGGSDSEDDEDRDEVATDTISTSSSQETVSLTLDAKEETLGFTRCAGSWLPGGGGWNLNPS